MAARRSSSCWLRNELRFAQRLFGPLDQRAAATDPDFCIFASRALVFILDRGLSRDQGTETVRGFDELIGVTAHLLEQIGGTLVGLLVLART